MVALVLAMILAGLACSFSGRIDSANNLVVNVELKESDINRLLERNSERLDKDAILRKITKVDLQEGLIRVFGTYEKEGVTLEGSYDLEMKAENGQLMVEIVGVDIEGVELSDERIQRMNDELSKDLAESARESHDEVEFTKVEVTEEAVKISLKVKITTK
jgi:hypothetical protein